jgi:hypothetical protein
MSPRKSITQSIKTNLLDKFSHFYEKRRDDKSFVTRKAERDESALGDSFELNPHIA